MMTNIPAGWYPDPEAPEQRRYWDGTSWTANRAPAPNTMTDRSKPLTSRDSDTTMPSLALVLAILGFVLGIVPFAAWFAWLLFVPALVLAIRALLRRSGGRGLSTASAVIVGAGWLISLAVGIGSLGAIPQQPGSVPAAAPETTSAASTTAPPPSATTAPASPLPSVGQTVTSHSGVGFTVTGMQCGLGPQDDDLFQSVAPKGQFCRVDFVVANGSAQPQDVSRSNLFGYIGKARYEADDQLGKFGADYFLTTVNPGLSVPCSVFFDVPPGASLDRIKLITDWWGGDGATVALK